jgi:hypothetical protein
MSIYPPRKNRAYEFYISLVDQGDARKFRVSPTIAVGDFRIQKDGGAFANLTTLPTIDPNDSVSLRVQLSAAEMNADNVYVTARDVAGAEWCDFGINIQTVAETSGGGALMFVYTLTNQLDSTPIADADVWVSTDSAGVNVVASGRTDAFGNVTFYLDAGTYYLWRQKTGWNFVNPDIETVS